MAMEAAPCWELGFRGKEVVQEGFVDLDRGVGLGEVGKTRGLAGSDELLRHPDVVGCGSSKEIGPVGVLGFLITLKYPCLGSRGRLTRSSVRSFLAFLQALAYSLRRAVRAGVHQGFNMGEGREVGVWRRMVAVRASRE